MSEEVKSRKGIITALIIANAVLLCVAAYIALNIFGIIGHDAPAAQMEDTLDAVTQAMKHVTYHAEPQADANGAQIMLGNNPDSTCAIRVHLVLLSSGETLAQTGLIDPGYYLERITFARPLPAGAHLCLLRFELCSMDGAVIGTAGRNLLLTIP